MCTILAIARAGAGAVPSGRLRPKKVGTGSASLFLRVLSRIWSHLWTKILNVSWLNKAWKNVPGTYGPYKPNAVVTRCQRRAWPAGPGRVVRCCWCCRCCARHAQSVGPTLSGCTPGRSASQLSPPTAGSRKTHRGSGKSREKRTGIDWLMRYGTGTYLCKLENSI